jgi:hypothetical protein
VRDAAVDMRATTGARAPGAVRGDARRCAKVRRARGGALRRARGGELGARATTREVQEARAGAGAGDGAAAVDADARANGGRGGGGGVLDGDRAVVRAGAVATSSVDGAFAALGRSVVAFGVAATVLSAVGASAWSSSSSSSSLNGGSVFTGTTGAPASASCANGTLSESRLKKAREVMTCNQDNWREGCLNNYDDDFYYVDGPGLTEVRGKKQMERYLRNQFDFSRQFLTVKEETCAADSYVATWSLDMLLSTGPLRNLSGISTLKFKPDSDTIIYHRDYLADGAITENSPVVGGLVKLQRQTYTSCMQSDIGCAKILGGIK